MYIYTYMLIYTKIISERMGLFFTAFSGAIWMFFIVHVLAFQKKSIFFFQVLEEMMPANGLVALSSYNVHSHAWISLIFK